MSRETLHLLVVLGDNTDDNELKMENIKFYFCDKDKAEDILGCNFDGIIFKEWPENKYKFISKLRPEPNRLSGEAVFKVVKD